MMLYGNKLHFTFINDAPKSIIGFIVQTYCVVAKRAARMLSSITKPSIVKSLAKS